MCLMSREVPLLHVIAIRKNFIAVFFVYSFYFLCVHVLGSNVIDNLVYMYTIWEYSGLCSLFKKFEQTNKFEFVVVYHI